MGIPKTKLFGGFVLALLAMLYTDGFGHGPRYLVIDPLSIMVLATSLYLLGSAAITLMRCTPQVSLASRSIESTAPQSDDLVLTHYLVSTTIEFSRHDSDGLYLGS